MIPLRRFHQRLLTAGIDADVIDGRVVTDVVTAKTKAEEREELNKAKREFAAKGKKVNTYKGGKGGKGGLTGRVRMKNLGGKEAASVTAGIKVEKARGKVYVYWKFGKGKERLLGSGNNEKQAITKAKHFLKVGNITTREYPTKVPSNALDSYKSSASVTAGRYRSKFTKSGRSQNQNDPKRAAWMTQFEKHAKSKLGGTHQVDWNSATYHWNEGTDAKDAATKYASHGMVTAKAKQITCRHDNCDHKFPHREGSKGCHKHPDHKHFDSSAVLKPTAAAKVEAKERAAHSVPDQHQLKILKDTVKNPLKGKFLGGPSAEESKTLLKSKFGWSDARIKKLEASVAPFDQSYKFDLHKPSTRKPPAITRTEHDKRANHHSREMDKHPAGSAKYKAHQKMMNHHRGKA